MPTTIYRLSEEILKLLNGGDPGLASDVSLNEVKISVGQVANQLLKTEYIQLNVPMREMIPNGAALGLYENIPVESWNNRSKCTLPVKPLKLPGNMGVFAIYPKTRSNGSYDLDNEYIPLQMGQAGLVRSQSMINDLLGQVGYEVFGTEVVFTKNIKQQFPDIVVAMRLAILDISLYDDWNILPVTPEHEWQIKQEVYKLYKDEPIPDKLVDSTTKENRGLPIKQQQQN